MMAEGLVFTAAGCTLHACSIDLLHGGGVLLWSTLYMFASPAGELFPYVSCFTVYVSGTSVVFLQLVWHPIIGFGDKILEFHGIIL